MNSSNTKPEMDINHTLGVDHSSRRSKYIRWLFYAVGILILITVVGLIWAKYKRKDSIQYITQPVKRENMTITVTATGNIKPTKEVNVSSELSGIVNKVYADYNDYVKVGQILVQLDTTKLISEVLKSKAALQGAEAKVMQGKASVTETQAKLERYKKVREMSSGKVPSAQDYDSAEASLQKALADEANAVAAVSEAQAVLKTDQTNLEKAVIRSPINGIILEREIEPGQTVAASLEAPTLFTLAESLTRMELQVDVDEADVSQITKGQHATFTVDAYSGRTFSAKISQVRYGSKTVNGVVTYKTVLEVDNSDMALRPGMTATAKIEINKVDNALLVPNTALRYTPQVDKSTTSSSNTNRSLINKILPVPPMKSPDSEGENITGQQNKVWILKDNQPVSVPITIGSTDGTMTEVKSGNITPGMEVITDTTETSK